MPQTKEIFLKDYRPSLFHAEHIWLDFVIDSVSDVVITATTTFKREEDSADLILDGNPGLVSLQSISLDDRELTTEEYRITEDSKLVIPNTPQDFKLRIVSRTDPSKNASCIGLYTSEGILCTQCESEGFRNFTWALDRPDVFSTYHVSIEAAEKDFPHLLSNGKKILSEKLAEGRHKAVWEDLRPKPTYLFALAAGKFDVVQDSFTYPSGKTVRLEYYVNEGDAHLVTHAMECLKASMQHEWEKWGHEYHSDSGVFMTLAVDAFIFGAMENTGLNIFNSSAVLADAKTATDSAFKNIDRIIDHEFCHDESGNWVVPRDWFQISFKEGLTVFRDQTYSADRYGKTQSQINNAWGLRGAVFPYDSGAMTHPMVLQSYINTDNNYDVLTYPKGAAVNRMIETLVGEKAYEEAYRKFFGDDEVKTATIEEYFSFIAQSTGKNLDQFIATWLNQAGVPLLEIQTEYLEQHKQFTLKVNQTLPVSKDAPEAKKTAFHIPLIIGLVGPEGKDYPLENGGLLEITALENTFVFHNIPERPRLSLNRDGITYAKFSYSQGSAPSTEDLIFLSQNDPNPFKRWDAFQEQAMTILLELISQKKEEVKPQEIQGIIDAMESFLLDETLDDGLKSSLLALPGLGTLIDHQAPGTVDPIQLHKLWESVNAVLGQSLSSHFLKTYRSKQSDAPYVFTPRK
jgi:aminopeptidase N